MIAASNAARSPSPDASTPELPPPPRNTRWEGITVAATFAFGGGAVSLALIGLAWLAMGPAFNWSMVSGFATVCIVAVVAGFPVLVIDRLRHREK